MIPDDAHSALRLSIISGIALFARRVQILTGQAFVLRQILIGNVFSARIAGLPVQRTS